MIAFSSPFSFRSGRATLALCALLAVLALPCTSFGQQSQADAEKKQLSEKVRDGMTKFGPLQDEKKWTEAIALLTDLQKLAQPGTYDEFLLAYVKGQIYLATEPPQAALAVAPLEEALRVSDQQGFFDAKDERKVLKYLAQIYYGEGSAKGVAPAKQSEFFIKATNYLKRLLDNERAEKAVSTDDVVFYAYLLVQRAQANPDKPEPVLLQEARKVTEDGMLLSITPRPEFYRLLLSVMLAQNDYPSAAEILELMLKKDPNNKDNWTQLAALYLNLASDDKNTDEKAKEKTFENNLRAIVTYERAQALGFLKTPKDNFQLVGTYANIGQIEHAAQLLDAGLRSGAIESDKNKWMYLAAWYQQLNRDQKTIDVLKEAAKHFPDTGEFEFMAAQNYYGMEKFEDAIQQAKAAAIKGLGDKTWTAWSLVGYTAFELRRYDEALEAVNKALSYPESKKDPQLNNVKYAAERAIKERAAQLDALKATQQR
jgi:tetratricopeptide (TPR) repeat protein